MTATPKQTKPQMRSTLKVTSNPFVGHWEARTYVFYQFAGDRRVRSFPAFLQPALEFCAGILNDARFTLLEVVDGGGTSHYQADIVDYLSLHHTDLLTRGCPIDCMPVEVYEIHGDGRWLSDDPFVEQIHELRSQRDRYKRMWQELSEGKKS